MALHQVKPVSAFMAEPESPLLRECGEALRTLVTAVRETGRPGALTLKITVKPPSAVNPATLVAGDVSIKTPVDNRLGSMGFFAGDQASLLDPETGEVLG